MSMMQKWLMVIAILIFAISMLLFAIGTILGAFTGRYRWAELVQSGYNGARYDTWTGEVEVRNGLHWERGAPDWINGVK